MPTSEPARDPLILDSRYGAVTLRDLFAAAALVGIWACPQGGDTHEGIARAAYNAADAMLRAREEAAAAE